MVADDVGGVGPDRRPDNAAAIIPLVLLFARVPAPPDVVHPLLPSFLPSTDRRDSASSFFIRGLTRRAETDYVRRVFRNARLQVNPCR